jgi:hypothetical protein
MRILRMKRMTVMRMKVMMKGYVESFVSWNNTFGCKPFLQWIVLFSNEV